MVTGKHVPLYRNIDFYLCCLCHQPSRKIFGSIIHVAEEKRLESAVRLADEYYSHLVAGYSFFIILSFVISFSTISRRNFITLLPITANLIKPLFLTYCLPINSRKIHHYLNLYYCLYISFFLIFSCILSQIFPLRG